MPADVSCRKMSSAGVQLAGSNRSTKMHFEGAVEQRLLTRRYSPHETHQKAACPMRAIGAIPEKRTLPLAGRNLSGFRSHHKFRTLVVLKLRSCYIR